MEQRSIESSQPQQKRILVVEDEEMNQKILKSDLKKAGYDMVFADHGQMALDILQEDQAFDLILLDRMMPVLSGMETLVQLKQDAVLKEIPVVVQTAEASLEQVQEGVDAGVLYYLTKPFSKAKLLTIVNKALCDEREKRQLISGLADADAPAEVKDGAVFHFQTPSEAKALALSLAQICEMPEKIVHGLYHLMVNAIEHGNWNIGFEQKKELVRSGKWQHTLEACQEDAGKNTLKATISYKRGGDGVVFTIEDQGKGFDWQPYMAENFSNATEPNGRGIYLAHAFCFDKVEFHAPGNKVTALVVK